MKVIILILLALLPVSAIEINQAIGTGQAFLKEHAVAGHNGVAFSSWELSFNGYTETDASYRISYTMSAIYAGMSKSRDLIVEMDKSNGQVLKVLVLKRIIDPITGQIFLL